MKDGQSEEWSRERAESREPPRQYQSGFLHSFHESFKSTFLAGPAESRTGLAWLETLNQMGIKMWAEDLRWDPPIEIVMSTRITVILILTQPNQDHYKKHQPRRN